MFKHKDQEDKHYARSQWEILCAKEGLVEASNINGSGLNHSSNEAHNARKTLRRAINQITAKMNASDFTNETTAGLQYAGQVIATISNDIAHYEDTLTSKNAPSGLTVMRNAADFAKHYKVDEQFNFGRDESEIGIADFLRGVGNLKTTPAVQNALSTGTDAAGGFTVPSVLMPGILSALVPVSSLLQAGAGIVPIEEGGKTFTTAAINSIPTASWRNEAGALATSDPTFRAVVATPRSLAFQFKMSRELLADGQGIESALYFAIGQAFAKELDRVGLRGTGTAPEPRGLSNTSGIQAVTNGTNGASLATNRYANVFSAVQAILQADGPMPTAAIMSPRSLVGLGQLADTTNQPLRVPGMLEKMSLIGTSQIPNTLTVGTSTDCSEMYVGDFANMFFSMRESVSIQMLKELYAGTGEIGFACHMRADVIVRYPAAFAFVTGIRP